MAKLTGAKLEARLEAGIASRAPGRHGFGGGLWLEVAGGRSWSHRYTTQGKARSMGLGAWPAVSLSRAREKVAANRALLDGGIDPIDERRREKATDTLAKARAITFDAAAETYIAGNEAKWRNPKNKGQWRSSLKSYASPILGRLPLSDITTDHVVRALRPIWHAKAETAVRVRGRIETVLAFGIAQGWCAEPNVARWHNHLQMICRRGPRSHPLFPTLPCPGATCRISWRSCASRTASARGPWSSPFSRPAAAARHAAPPGMRSTSTPRSGRSLRRA